MRIVAPGRELPRSDARHATTPVAGAKIRYTLDGSDPTPDSPAYDEPLLLTETTEVRARAFAEGLDDRFVAGEAFRRLTLHERSPRPNARAGARLPLLRGRVGQPAGLRTLAPARSETVSRVEIPKDARPENFALELTGLFLAPGDGLYTFGLASDDGSALYVDDARAIDNDGLHGNQERIEHVALLTGAHAIRVQYFQRGGDRGVALLTAGPGIALQPVPAAWLVHAAEQE